MPIFLHSKTMKINSLATLLGALALQSILFVAYTSRLQTIQDNFPNSVVASWDASSPTKVVQHHQRMVTEQTRRNTSNNNHRPQQQQQQTTNSSSSVVILAAVPMDERHVVALWTELECFVGEASHVVLSSAYWARPLVDRILQEALANIPHFASNKVTLEARFFDNQRYDVGLWCDGMQGFYSENNHHNNNHNHYYDHFVLLNDSIFALRKFNGILEDLQSHHNRSMTSLNYIVDDEGAYWYESVFRGFSRDGLSIFSKHSCVPQDHKSFCKHVDPRRKDSYRKRCIVDYHEVALAKQFPPQPKSQGEWIVKGLYDGKVPDRAKLPRNKHQWLTWVQYPRYWEKFLVAQQQFPAAKVNQLGMINQTDDPRLGECTQHLNRSMLGELDFHARVRSLNY